MKLRFIIKSTAYTAAALDEVCRTKVHGKQFLDGKMKQSAHLHRHSENLTHTKINLKTPSGSFPETEDLLDPGLLCGTAGNLCIYQLT